MYRSLLSFFALCWAISTPAAEPSAPPAIRFAVPELGESVSVTALANRIYQEAFRRLGYEYAWQPFPGERGIMLTEAGEVDGLVHRARVFNKEHPSLILVEETVGSVGVVACTTRADLRISAWEELKGATLEVDYWRDIRYIGNKLEPLVAAERLETVASQESGLRKLVSGRADLFLTLGEVVEVYLHQPEFADKGIRIAGELERIDLYPYLAPRQQGLAAPLAGALQRMKAEGLFDRYQRELGAAR